MRSFLILFSLTAVIGRCWAQQDPIYAQYMFNPVIMNPGYTGINNNLVALAGHRIQWTGFEGQPRTFSTSIHSSIMENKLGAGLIVLQDQAGNLKITEAAVTVAYKIELKNQTLSFGMQFGMQDFRMNNEDLNIYDPGDLAFEGAEPGTRINVGTGVVLKNERYFIGLSVPRMLPSTFSSSGVKFDIYQQHYYLAGAYVIFLNHMLDLRPSVLLRATQGAPVSADIGMNLNLNRAHSVGLFTRNNKTYGILLQTLLKDKFRIGYAFELPTARSVGNPFTTHEISLGIITTAFSFQSQGVTTF